jgi:hypothetical protein
MLAIYVNSKHTTEKLVVCAPDLFKCLRIALRYYRTHHIKGEPIRVML